MKKVILILLVLLLSACEKLQVLPMPELESGIRGQDLGIDKNINEATIDNYLNRSDSVYIDCRLLEDEANFEAIGGDSKLSGYIKGFEIIPFPYICTLNDLPIEVGQGYVGPTLFTLNKDGTYTANYKESYDLLNKYFPKDKVIFLMCGGGGYAGMMKKLLVANAYDENKIYNVGGYWYYQGENSISTIKEDGSFDYTDVPIKEIDFASLNPINGYDPNNIIHVNPRNEYINKLDDVDSLNSLIDKSESFLLLVSLDTCTSCAEFKPILNDYAKDGELKVYEIAIDKVDKYLDVKYTPTLQLYEKGKLIKQLEPTSDEDIKFYKNLNNLIDWIEN